MTEKLTPGPRIEDLEKPVAELRDEAAEKAAGGVILMEVLPPLDLFEIQGITFPTREGSNDGRHRP